jgi:hypothetical protein
VGHERRDEHDAAVLRQDREELLDEEERRPDARPAAPARCASRIDRLRYEAGQPTPLSVPVTSDARARTPVRTHALSTYDGLQSPGELLMTTTSSEPLGEQLKHLRLYGCLARIDEVRGEPWLERVMGRNESVVHRCRRRKKQSPASPKAPQNAPVGDAGKA